MTASSSRIAKRVASAAILIGALVAMLAIGNSTLEAATCPSANNRFHVCYYEGTTPGQGLDLGSQNEPSLGNPAPTRVFGINHQWSSGPVFAGRADNISAIWHGRFNFPAGRYQFSVWADDAVRLYIDDVRVLPESWVTDRQFADGQGMGDPDGTGIGSYAVSLQFSQQGYHNVRVEWFEIDSTAELVLHWDKGPTVSNPIVSTVNIEAFILREQRICIVGDQWTGEGPAVQIHKPDGSPYLSWKDNANVKGLKQSDPGCGGCPPGPNSNCFTFGFPSEQIPFARKQLEDFARKVEEWTFGALRPTLRITELTGEIPISRLAGNSGWWVGPSDLKAAVKPLVNSNTDFTIAVTAQHAIDSPHAGYYYDTLFGYCATLAGPDPGLLGAGYNWIPDHDPGPGGGCALNPDVIASEWGHTFRCVIICLFGHQPAYPDESRYPHEQYGTYGFPPCAADDNGALDSYTWYSGHYSAPYDPASPWCGWSSAHPDWPNWPVKVPDGPRHQPQLAAHLLWHFDPALRSQYYPLAGGQFTGNHCSDGRLDYGESGVDAGGNCPGQVPPTIALTQPGIGEFLSGVRTVSAVADDNYSVTRVDFLIDGALVATDSWSPYQYAWDTRSVADGCHIVSARAVDDDGLSTTATAGAWVANSTGGIDVDSDGDGFNDRNECYIGTEIIWECAATSTLDDEPVDSWPPDFNDDKFSDGTDITILNGHMFSQRGDPKYNARYDLYPDGFIDGTDQTVLGSYFGQGCTRHDADGDGFLDGAERYMGTNINLACPTTSTPDDEAIDAWPPDFNDDRAVDQIGDQARMNQHMFTVRGDPAYDPRFDLNADGRIDVIGDQTELNRWMFRTCS